VAAQRFRRTPWPLVIVAVMVLGLAISVIGGYCAHWPWTGFQDNNTVWDWLGLFLLPVAVALLPMWLRFSRRNRLLRYCTLAILATVFAALLFGGYVQQWRWTGFRDRAVLPDDPGPQTATLWDWLTVALLPITVVLVPAWLRSRSTRQASWRIACGMLAAIFAVLIIGGYRLNWTWTGFSGNELWDWLHLLLVPFLLPVALAYAEYEWPRELRLSDADTGPGQQPDSIVDAADHSHHPSITAGKVRTGAVLDLVRLPSTAGPELDLASRPALVATSTSGPEPAPAIPPETGPGTNAAAEHAAVPGPAAPAALRDPDAARTSVIAERPGAVAVASSPPHRWWSRPGALAAATILVVAVMASTGWLLLGPGEPVRTPVPSDTPIGRRLPVTSPSMRTASPNASLPASYRRVHAPAGLTVAIPAGWTVKAAPNLEGERRASDTTTRHRWLQYGGYATANPSQLGRVLRYEKVSKHHNGYLRLELAQVRYGRAPDAVDWEYTYIDGGERHAYGRYWRVGGREYVVYGIAPRAAWPDTRAVLLEVLKTASPQ
jgi:hypothetical protein